MTRAKGSLGNLTIVTSKGRMIAKQKITIMSNPKTEKQTTQRNALALAVALWKYVGATIKSGITAYPQYGSQYSGFVRQNIAFLKNSPINPNALRNLDLLGLQATSGALGTVNFNLSRIEEDNASLTFPAGALRNIAKVGDYVKFIVGSDTSSEMGFFEKVLTATDLTPSANAIIFDDSFAPYLKSSVFVAWVESADGQKSTTQYFAN